MEFSSPGFNVADLALLRSAPAGGDTARAAPREDELRAAARQFEALFVKQLLSQLKMASGLGGEDTAQTDFVNSLWRDTFSEQISAGAGLGLAELLARQIGGAADAAQGPGLQAALVRGPDAARVYASSEPGRFETRQEFVDYLRPYVEQASQALGVSPQILLAQAALETGWGARMPVDAQGDSSHNLFGIKADARWSGKAVEADTREYTEQGFHSEQARFRRYPSYAQSVQDYVAFLHENPRYQPALEHGGSDERFLQGLKSAGYATDPLYVEKVMDVARGSTLARYWNEI